MPMDARKGKRRLTMPDDREVISRIEGREEDDAEYLFDDFSD